MLEFCYDFMDHYLSHDDFQYVEVDTDSAYFGIAGQNVEDFSQAFDLFKFSFRPGFNSGTTLKETTDDFNFSLHLAAKFLAFCSRDGYNEQIYQKAI